MTNNQKSSARGNSLNRRVILDPLAPCPSDVVKCRICGLENPVEHMRVSQKGWRKANLAMVAR